MVIRLHVGDLHVVGQGENYFLTFHFRHSTTFSSFNSPFKLCNYERLRLNKFRFFIWPNFSSFCVVELYWADRRGENLHKLNEISIVVSKSLVKPSSWQHFSTIIVPESWFSLAIWQRQPKLQTWLKQFNQTQPRHSFQLDAQKSYTGPSSLRHG